MRVTREELIHLLDTHILIVDGEVWGKEQVINYLVREFERQEEELVKKLNDKLEVCLN
jgi:uncharacterized Ntn-hydrolase superfamily protein